MDVSYPPGSGQFGVLNRELAHAFTSGREQRVTERRSHGWHAWLAHAGRQVITRQEVHMRLIGCLSEARHRVVVVVGQAGSGHWLRLTRLASGAWQKYSYRR